MIGIVLVWSFPLVLAKASVNSRTDSARVCVDILDHQGTSFGNPTGGVETNSKQGVIATGKQTFVEQKLDFLLREYFGLAVPFYLHAGVYTRPDTRKFAALTALLHPSGGFFNVVVQLWMVGVEYTADCR
jgi:hypothetical protein